MTPYYWAALGMLAAVVPCLWAARRWPWRHALVAAQAVGTIVPTVLLLLAAGSSGASLTDLALAGAVLALGGSLVFVRALEQWS